MPPKKTNVRSRLKLLEKQFFLHGAAGREQTFQYEMPDSDIALWPHSLPSAKLMANCGFYFAPTKKLTDRVCCIGCHQLQHSWEGAQNPAQHHLAKHPDCPFSLVHYYSSLRETEAVNWSEVPVFRDPLSDQATAIRASTFSTHWPFDKIKGATPTSDKMIAAGFSSFPQDQDDDLASCMYCGTCLEGWELGDDPMYEHTKRADGHGCYFLEMLQQSKKKINNKRLSEEEDLPVPKAKKTKFVDEISDRDTPEPVMEPETKSKKSKKKKKSPSPDAVITEEPVPPTRPRRAAREASKKIVDLSDDDEDNSDVELLDDESFGLTSNEEQLESDPDPYRSSQRSSNIIKGNTPKAQKSVSASPLKKSKILDSSFEAGEGDMFASKKLDEGILQSLPLPQKKSTKETSPDVQGNHKSSPLKDITNLSEPSLIISPKKRAKQFIIEEEDDDESDEEEIILVSNSSNLQKKENISGSSFLKESTPVEKGQRPTESSSTLKPDTIAEKEPEEAPQTSPQQQQEVSKNAISRETSLSDVEQSPLASKAHSPSIKSEHSGSLSRLKLNKTLSNKSIFTQTRFFESPKPTKRSQSPFLDANHRGNDHIGETDPIIGPDDNPIEESTDHNIELSLSELDRQLENKDKVFVKAVQESHVEEQERPHDGSLENHETNSKVENALDRAPSLQPADLDAAEDTFHSAGETTPADYWPPTDTNKVFQHLDDLETAKTYLAELKTLEYDLHDDVDGRVTTFINQMPEEELDMTIEQWILHMAKQGKNHLEQVCNKMMDDFDKECQRAMDKLKNLPTVG